MRITKLMPSLSGVAGGSTAVLNCPLGLTYDSIKFHLSGVTLPDITNIKVLINGKVIQSFKGALQLGKINKYHKRGHESTGYMTLWFIDPSKLSLQDKRATAIGTSDIKTFSVEFDIDSGVVSPVITATAVQSNPSKLGVIRKVKEFPLSSATAGLIEVDNIPTSNARIQAIHCFKNDVDKVEVEIDSRKAFEATKSLTEALVRDYDKQPQANCTHVDFQLEGDLTQAIVTQGVQDLRLRMTLGTAGQVGIVVEYLDGLGGI